MGHEIPGPNEIYIYINDSSRESNRAAWRDDTREIKHECFLLFLRSARASSSSIPIQPVQLPRFWTKTDTRLLKTALTINNRSILSLFFKSDKDGRRRRRKNIRNGGTKKKERGEREKNCSHELNAARKKYHSRQQPYYPSNGGRTDPRTGEEKKNGGKKSRTKGKT